MLSPGSSSPGVPPLPPGSAPPSGGAAPACATARRTMPWLSGLERSPSDRMVLIAVMSAALSGHEGNPTSSKGTPHE